uniref:Uncharacterized protein n=1 Tax=Oryza sativa subsp. japonica TaxID=39947 RepID=Q69TC9_ORYSJ|nr:hypothetical protein [Oryza sativa Japonica Group]
MAGCYPWDHNGWWTEPSLFNESVEEKPLSVRLRIQQDDRSAVLRLQRHPALIQGSSSSRGGPSHSSRGQGTVSGFNSWQWRNAYKARSMAVYDLGLGRLTRLSFPAPMIRVQ